MYCVKGNSSWYISCRPLFGGCPLLGVSVIGGSTVAVIIAINVVIVALRWRKHKKVAIKILR